VLNCAIRYEPDRSEADEGCNACQSLPSPQLLSDAVDICDAVIAEDRLR
jgi:hypothetical protein